MHSSTQFEPLKSLLAFPPIERTRRNHGLEHGTVTLLSQKIPGLKLAGRSTSKGFYIYGKASPEALTEAAHEALRRIKAGEVELAIHPNCGTNLVTKGIAAGLTAYFSFLGTTPRTRLKRFPFVALLSAIVATLAQPAGLFLQRHITTSAEMRDLRIIGVKRTERTGMVTHFVTTSG